MKTTLEIPDDLYQEAKLRAAAQKRKVRELVSEGLRTVLAKPDSPSGDDSQAQQAVLAALDEIVRSPVPSKGRTVALQREVRLRRSEGWSRGRE